VSVWEAESTERQIPKVVGGGRSRGKLHNIAQYFRIAEKGQRGESKQKRYGTGVEENFGPPSLSFPSTSVLPEMMTLRYPHRNKPLTS